MICIADDIVVFWTGDGHHDHYLVMMMNQTREVGNSLNPDKCFIKLPPIGFYGLLLNQLGIMPDPAKVAAIKNMPPLKNVTQLLSFLSSIYTLHHT